MPKKRRASDASASSERIEDFLSEKLLRKVEDNIFARRTNKCDKAVREGQKVFQELEGKLKDVQRGCNVTRQEMYADFTAQHLAGRKNLVGSFSRLKELDASIQAILAEVFAELDQLGNYKEETAASRAKIIEAERSAKSLHKAIEDDTVGQSTAAPAPPILTAGGALKQNPDLCVKADVDVSKSAHSTKRKKFRTTDQTLVNSD